MNTFVKIPGWLKVIILLIPIFIVGYLLYANFIQNQEFNYFYDIGSPEDSLKPYLAPLNRTSEIIDNYRNINHRLVYFNIPYTKGSENMLVTVKFLTDLNNSFSLGIKNNIGWNYTWTNFDNYLPQEDDWVIAERLFSLSGSYPEKNKLSLSFDIIELSKNPENSTFFIDWINITVYKPGVFS